MASDADLLAKHHRFVRDESEVTPAAKVAIKYESRLFKEYALADLSRSAEGKIGLRWRTRREVESGKGHFVCGSTSCSASDSPNHPLASYEVLFKYREAGETKRELVKVRVCEDCAPLLRAATGKGRDKEKKEPRKKATKRKRPRERDEFEVVDAAPVQQ